MKNQTESSAQSAYLYIIKLLTKRDYSKYKLRVKLESKGFEDSHINEAIEVTIEKGFLKEYEYATARAKALMKKGFHPSLIENKLAEEHLNISSEVILEVFEDYKVTITSQLEELITKKLRTISPTQLNNNLEGTKQKVIRFCLTKGHDLESIIEALELLIPEVNSLNN
mgnify:CR=1 FL=1